MWKVTVVAYLKILVHHLPNGTEVIHKDLVIIAASGTIINPKTFKA
jgi:hypothetical protein